VSAPTEQVTDADPGKSRRAKQRGDKVEPGRCTVTCDYDKKKLRCQKDAGHRSSQVHTARISTSTHPSGINVQWTEEPS
jgi:hypothetical protein